jgi:quinol monooxygenase YgiN
MADSTSLVRRVARFRVCPDQLDRAQAAIREFVTHVAADEPGTLRYEALAEAGGASGLHFMEFADAHAEAEHRRTPHLRRFVEAIYPICAEAPSFAELTPVAQAGAPGIAVRCVRHVERLPAEPAAVWRALMDPVEHAAFTGMSAQIAPDEGGRFSTCGGLNFGFHLALEPGRRIVQAWSHRDFPDHHFTVADFQLAPCEGGARLEFTQLGVPVAAFGWIDSGWRSTYWEPLRRHLARAR